MKISYWKFSASILLFLTLPFLFNSCKEEAQIWDVKSTEQVITQFVEGNPQYSEFAKLLQATDLNSLLSVRGPFTLFLPDNEAMEAFYAANGVTSYLDFEDPSFARKFVFNHLIGSSIKASDIGLGALQDTNALGDYLVTEFEGSDIILNKHSKIVDRDVPVSNGTIHLINRAIDMVTINVYDLMAGNPSFSLFVEGLKRTGLKDTLQVITFPYGNKIARTRFTVLAVADTTFSRYGITNIDELISYFTKDKDSITFLNNPFYRFMEYHCLGGTFFLNNFATKLYPILSYDNNISITIDNDYKLNYDKISKKYTGFFVPESNNPAKNGTYHTITDLLPVIEPEPIAMTFETTDFFDMRQGDYYGKYYMRWFDGQNTFANIKWEGDYMLYYYKPASSGWNLNGDCLSMSGWWWIEVTTPKIMKGKYRVSGNIWSGGDKSNYSIYVDGKLSVYITNADAPITTSWGEFEWSATDTHKIKAVAKSSGLVFWDTIVFTPIK
jgi:uncharacterized surface protein with fasciclin (FAS1) repeats